MNRKQRKQSVAIAQDILARLKANKLRANAGTYVKGYIVVDPDTSLLNSAQPFAEKIQEECKVCAMGACFLSYIKLYNNVPLDDFMYRAANNILATDDWSDFKIRITIGNILQTVFSEDQLALIEAAFERKDSQRDYVRINYVSDPELYKKAVRFGKRYKDDAKRLAAIMRNVVKNNGEFIL